MPDRIAHLTTVRPLIDSRSVATQEMRSWAQSLTSLSMITGEGNPENVIEAVAGALYMNNIGTAGNILYIKRNSSVSGDKKKGWIIV